MCFPHALAKQKSTPNIKINMSKRKKIFRKTANRTKKINTPMGRNYRGGTRL